MSIRAAHWQDIAAKTFIADELQAYRKHHWQQYLVQGIPQRSNERWKYADLTALTNLELQSATNEFPKSELATLIHKYKSERPNHLYFVFVNGVFLSEYSDQQHLPAHVKVTSLRSKIKASAVEPVEFNIPENYPFANLNAALCTDGLYFSLPDDCVMERPIQMLAINTQEKHMIHTRHFIKMGARSKMTYIEDYFSVNPSLYWTNVVTHVHLQPQARLEYCKLQRESEHAIHFAHTFIKLAQHCELTHSNFATGGHLVRDDVLIQIEGAGVNCHTSGFYQPQRPHQYIDQHIDVEHLAPQSQSEMLYKGIIGPKATAVFNGRVYVAKAAQKTVAVQANQHLLLAQNATGYAKPELEINADDVKCKHGAATGQLDEEILFYLRSRGLSADDAVQMLLSGFAEEVIQRAPVSTRTFIKNLLSSGMGVAA